jgi:hypothetical protein
MSLLDLLKPPKLPDRETAVERAKCSVKRYL